MATYDDHVAMISAVARAIGPELCQQVAFVGGCTTALLLTDTYTLQQVRHTDDVDLIVHVISKAGWYQLRDVLQAKGFKDIMDADAPICAMGLNGLRVDFMPDDASILSFTNLWYKDALKHAEARQLRKDLSIRLVRPEYFIATKLEAYLGRGNNDPLESRDIEDILTLFDGRPELLDELRRSPGDMRAYISLQLAALLEQRDFAYAVESAALGDADREQLIIDRIKTAVSYGALR